MLSRLSVQALPSAGSPSAGPASWHGASLAEHLSAASEVVMRGEAE